MDLEDCNGLLAEIERQVPEAAELYELKAADAAELALLREQVTEVLMHGAAKAE